jgi:peptidoglycan/LPS O-acetylase OafA/YrhL
LYPFFLQNFAWNIGGTLFSHSWSLAIEEFFYLFFPLILWLLFLVVPQPPRRAFLTVTLLFIGLPLLLRILHGPEADFAAFDASIRKWVIFRLDALMFGVGMAVAKRYYPDFWQAVYRGTPATALLASALLLFLIFGLHLLVVFPFLQLVIFPIISLTVALTLPWADGWKLQPGWAGRLVESISCSSYSTYLAHPMLLILAYRLSHAARHGLPGWLMAPLVAVYMLLGGYLLYLLIEKPLMKLREVWNARFGADARRQPTDTLGAPLKSEV